MHAYAATKEVRVFELHPRLNLVASDEAPVDSIQILSIGRTCHASDGAYGTSLPANPKNIKERRPIKRGLLGHLLFWI